MIPMSKDKFNCDHCENKKGCKDKPWGDQGITEMCTQWSDDRKDIDAWMVDYPTCPYCGYVDKDPGDCEDGDYECQSCEKVFILRVDRSVSYTSLIGTEGD